MLGTFCIWPCQQCVIFVFQHLNESCSSCYDLTVTRICQRFILNHGNTINLMCPEDMMYGEIVGHGIPDIGSNLHIFEEFPVGLWDSLIMDFDVDY